MFIENYNLGVVQKKDLLCILISLLLLFFSATVWTSETKKFYVKMPSPCYEIKKIKGKNVYLESTGKTCMQVMIKKEIVIDSSVKKVSIYADGKFWMEQDVENFNMNSIRDLQKGTGEIFDNLQISENKYKDMAGKYAAQTKQYYESKAFQGKCRAETERLKASVFKEQIEGARRTYSEVPGNAAGTLPPSERIYLFISSSMPEQTLKSYASAIAMTEDPNIEMVMRGFVGGIKKFVPTREFIQRITSKPDGNVYAVSILIDPLLFRKYGIGRVPCIVYDNDVGIDIHAASADNPDNYYALFGDVSFEYAVRRIQEEAISETLKAVLASLRGGIYGKERKK